MKIIKSTPRPKGVTRLTIELDEGEDIRVIKDGDELLTIKPGEFYSLGYPLQDDIIAGHILAGATRVHWCSIEQKWREA